MTEKHSHRSNEKTRGKVSDYVNLEARRLVGDETDALNLALVVESNDTDE
ncbi:hypothetical protein GCM10023322_84280 [Rugosimonospora acidiphila]|uniref:Uncharacterized protein n=1 Tax=Rugosimonospora acidiphila TaxID=556531 RepID=A0ABP9SW49_9ACTN